MVLSEAPFCPLMLLQLCCWTLAWRAELPRRQAAWALAGGLAAGLATLMRPSWLLFTPVAVALGLLRPSDWRRHVWLGLWLIVGLVAAMAPWWVRNWQVAGRFVPTTLQVGESLYDGLNPQATGASDMRFVDQFRADLRAQDAAHPWAADRDGCFEARLDRRMRDAAIRLGCPPPRTRRPVGSHQVRTDLERVAERSVTAKLGIPRGARYRVPAGAGRGTVGRLANGWPRLAVRPVPSTGHVLHGAARGVRRFDPLPPARAAGADRSGRRIGGSMVARQDGLTVRASS